MSDGWVDVDLSSLASDSSSLQDRLDETQRQNAPVTWGDYGKDIQANTVGLGKGLLGGVEYLGRKVNLDAVAPEFMKGVAEEKQSLGQTEEDITKSMSARAQRNMQASIFDSDSPGSTIGLKAAGFAPSIVAGLIPGGIAARAALAAGAGAGTAATVGALAGSVPQSVAMGGDVFNEIEKGITEAPDDQLMKQSSVYRGLRDMGLGEVDAKRHLVDQSAAYAPLIMMAAGELVGRMGTEGLVAARAAGQTAEGGIVKSLAKNAGSETVKQGTLAGSQDILTQAGNQRANDDLDMHWGEALKAAAEGAVLGGITGGPLGAVLHRGAAHSEQKLAEQAPAKEATPTMVDEDPAQQLAVKAEQSKGISDVVEQPTVRGGDEPQFAPAEEHVADEEVTQPQTVTAAVPPPPGPKAEVAQAEPLGTPLEPAKEVMPPATISANDTPATSPHPEVRADGGAEAPAGPRVLVDQAAEAKVKAQMEAEAAQKDKDEATAERYSAPRTSKAEREAFARGEGALHTLSRDEKDFGTDADRKQVKRVLADEVEAAKEQGRDLKPWAAEMVATEGQRRGNSAGAKAARERYAAARKALHEEISAAAGTHQDRQTAGQSSDRAAEEKRATNAKVAKETIEANPIPKGALVGHGGMRRYLETLLGKAKEAGLELPSQAHGRMTAHELHLLDGRELLSALQRNQKGAVDQEFARNLVQRSSDFAGDRALLQAGHGEEIRNRRQIEATKHEASYDEAAGEGEGSRAKGEEDKSLEQAAGKDVNDNIEDDATGPREAEHDENSPEELLARKQEAPEPITPERVQKASEKEDGPAVQGFENRAGKFKVETVAKGGRRKLTPPGKIEPEKVHAAEGWDHVGGAGGKPAPERTGRKFSLPGGEEFQAVRSTSLKSMLDELAPRLKHNVVNDFFARRLKEMVPGTQVHVLAREDLDRVARTYGRDHGADGFYSQGTRQIFLSHDHARDAEHLVVHEGLHAAFSHLIDSRADLKADIRRLMDHTEKHLGERTLRPYGLSDEHEFISEAFSNEEFQVQLAMMPAPERFLAGQPLHNAWQWFVAKIRQALGMPRGYESALEAAIRLGQKLTTERSATQLPATNKLHALPRSVEEAHEELFKKPLERTMKSLSQLGKDGVGPAAKKLGWKFVTNDQFRQMHEKLFHGGEAGSVLRQLVDLNNRMGSKAVTLRHEGDELGVRLAKSFKQNPELFGRFSKLLNDMTMHGVDPRSALGSGLNKHLAISKSLRDKLDKGARWQAVAHEAGFAGWAARDAHPGLVKDYNELVKADPSYKKHMADALQFFQDRQRDMTLGHIETFIQPFLGDKAKARAAQILHEPNTQEAREKLASEFDEATEKAITTAKKLSGLQGPYVPLMRRGDWVVTGRYKLTPGGKKISDTEFEFPDRKAAKKWAESTGLDYDVDKRYFDPQTGERVGKLAGESSAGSPREAYVVSVNRDHVEFHPSLSAAREAIENHRKSDVFEALHEPQERRDLSRTGAELTGQTLRLLEDRLKKSEGYGASSDTGKEAMLTSLREAALAAQAGSRVQSRRLPRRNVRGASEDFLRNLHEYNTSQANFRARQEFRPRIDEGVKSMFNEVTDRRMEKDTPLRSMVANEMERRLRIEDPDSASGAWSDWSRRIGMISFLDRMMRPSHLILHQTHLPMITAPVLAARHHAMPAIAEISRNWRQMVGAYGIAARDTKQAAPKWLLGKGDQLHQVTDWHAFAKKKFGDDAGVVKMLNELHELSIIHQGHGNEVQRFITSSESKGMLGAMDKAFNTMDRVYRHANEASDAIIRNVGAVSAYRLERAKLTREGKSAAQAHAGAVEYARTTIANTQGIYAGSNAAPVFKNKWARPFLQFKQFPQMMYHLLIKSASQAFKGADRATKIEGFKQLGGVLFMHSLMAGTLAGIPLELPMVLAAALKGLGITNKDWGDVEDAEKHAIESVVGETAGHLIENGFARALGVDAHHRLGLNSFFTFGMPHRYNRDEVRGFLLNQILGAPFGVVEDAARGVNQMFNGDIVDGATRAFPLQALRDWKLAITGGDGNYPYTPSERVVQALGFTPAGKARMGETIDKSIAERAKGKDARATLVKQFFAARDDEARREVIDRINQFNRGATRADHIGVKGLQLRLNARGRELEEARGL